MTSKHKCPIIGCAAMLPRHILMCKSHWRLVPKDVQRDLLTHWKIYCRSVGYSEYFDARRRVVDSVNKLLSS